MASVIDVHDLPEEVAKLIQQLVECLRQRAGRKPMAEEKEVGEVVFTAHPSDVIGDLTRREIYDHL
jgi:hypothetical protein